MSWTQRMVASVVLAAMAVLPVLGTVCALGCESAAAATTTEAPSHHGSGESCEAAGRAADDTQVRGLSELDCSRHATSSPPVLRAWPGRAARDIIVPGELPIAGSRAVVAILTKAGNTTGRLSASRTARGHKPPLVLRV